MSTAELVVAGQTLPAEIQTAYARGEVGAGRWEGVPDHVYHAAPWITRSKLRLVMRSPAHFLAARENPPEPTPAMRFGRAAHVFVLQPHLISELFVEERPQRPPGIDRRRKEGKEAYERWEREVLGPWEERSLGREELTAGDIERLPKMVAKVEATPTARFLLGLGTRESSFVWRDPTTGLWCQCRPDVTGENRRLLVDYKTTSDARPEPFSRAIGEYGYHQQAAFYLDGVNAVLGPGTVEDFAFVAQEKVPPFEVGTYMLDRADIERGRRENELALGKLAQALAENKWPGYAHRINPIGLSRWHRRQIDQGEPA